MNNNDTYFEYNFNTQTLIGNKKRELLDTETGELIFVDQITKRVYGTKNFWKCYMMDFLNILGIIDNRQLDVFIHICNNTNQSNNMFIGTYKKISADVKCSSATIATIMKKLQDNNFLKKVQNGVWLVNPNILMRGNDNKRQILLSYYHADEPFNNKDNNINATNDNSELVKIKQIGSALENKKPEKINNAENTKKSTRKKTSLTKKTKTTKSSTTSSNRKKSPVITEDL